VCVVLVADCLPVLFCDRSASVVAAAHAGWRGLSAGVLEATVSAMQVPPSELLAYLGPAIGPHAFEVGADVLEAFARVDPGARACFTHKAPGPDGAPKWLCDLPGLARRRLTALGIDNISGGGLCTVADPARFFSHRRDRRTGRQAALIWLEP
jgi:YfiH family protein